MLDENTHDATFFFPFINLDAFENLSPENSPTNWQNWAIAPIATKLHVVMWRFRGHRRPATAKHAKF